MTYYITLDEAVNQFEFTCPIFDTQVKMRHCTKLRDLVYSGNRPEVRKGCQACITSSKCPAAEIVRKISFGKGMVGDDYGSKTPVVGKVRKDVLERVHRVIVLERVLQDYAVPDSERLMIETSSERIGKMIGAAPLPSGDAPKHRRSSFDDDYVNVTTAGPKRKSAAKSKGAPKPDNSNNAVNDAAATGDLAAAINA